MMRGSITCVSKDLACCRNCAHPVPVAEAIVVVFGVKMEYISGHAELTTNSRQDVALYT